jgi:hypothetical protein
MQVDLAFGQNGLTLDVPEGFHYRVLETRSAVPLNCAEEAVRLELDDPTAARP